MRIAVIGTRGFGATYSGIERIGQVLYPALAERGHQIRIYTRFAEDRWPLGRGVSLSTRRAARVRWGPVETLSHSITSLLHAALDKEVDVLHVHALAPAYWGKVFAHVGIPTVLTVHGLDWKRARWHGVGSRILRTAEHRAVQHMNEMIVVSSDLHQYFRGTYRRETHLIHNATMWPGPLRTSATKTLGRFGLEPGRFLLSVGRLVPEKRIEDLIRAFSRVSGHCDTKLAIVGEGSRTYVNELKRLGEGNPKVKFLGLQESNVIGELLSECIAYVAPSEMEGFPLAVMEAASSGAPVILSKIPPHVEMFETFPHATFFSVGVVEDLSNCLERHIAEPSTWKALAASASDKFIARFSVGEMVERTERVLELAASRRHAKGRP